jgi:cobalt-zinc-cadmium efflux system protein
VVADCFDADAYGAIKNAVAEALEPYGLVHTTVEIELNEEFCRDGSGRPTGRRDYYT